MIDCFGKYEWHNNKRAAALIGIIDLGIIDLGIIDLGIILFSLTLTALHIFCVFYETTKYFLSNQAINKKIFIKCAILRNSRNPL